MFFPKNICLWNWGRFLWQDTNLVYVITFANMFNVIYTENIQKENSKICRNGIFFSRLLFLFLTLNLLKSENASPVGQNQAMKNENLIKALCETTEKCKALEIPFTRMQ